jgi:hypothetical protein
MQNEAAALENPAEIGTMPDITPYKPKPLPEDIGTNGNCAARKH